MKQKVQVWMVTPGGKETLLLKLTDARGGHWQPVTGGVDQGEQWLGAARREMLEETGLSSEQWLDLGRTYEYVGKWGKTQERVFVAVIDPKDRAKNAVRLDSKEHQAFEWVQSENVESRLPLKWLEQLESWQVAWATARRRSTK